VAVIILVASLQVEGVSKGETTLKPIAASIARANGSSYPVKVVGGHIRVIVRYCRIELSNVTLTVNGTATVDVWLVNCSDAAGVKIKLSYNPTMIRIVGVKAGTFKKLVNGLFEYKINNKTGTLSIAAAGPRPCNSKKVLIAQIKIEGLQPGITYLKPVEATVSNAEGKLLLAKVTGGHIKILKVQCDFNHNNRLDVGDVVLLLRILVGEFHSNVPCDLNHNGKLDIGDAVLLLKKLVNT